MIAADGIRCTWRHGPHYVTPGLESANKYVALDGTLAGVTKESFVLNAWHARRPMTYRQHCLTRLATDAALWCLKLVWWYR